MNASHTVLKIAQSNVPPGPPVSSTALLRTHFSIPILVLILGEMLDQY